MPKILFTSQNAREMALKSAEVRRQAKAAETATASTIALADLRAIEEAEAKPDEYLQMQRARVRGHLNQIDELIRTAIADGDAGAVEKLARARGSFEEQDRRYSCRSLPPTVSRRIEPIKPGRRGGGASLDDVPASQAEPAAPTEPPSDQPAPPAV